MDIKYSGKFSKGYNAGTAVCYCCGKRTQAGIMLGETSSTGLCRECYDEAGYENQHSDSGGDHHGLDNSDCPLCFPEKIAARRAKRSNEAAAKAEQAKFRQSVITARTDLRQGAFKATPVFYPTVEDFQNETNAVEIGGVVWAFRAKDQAREVADSLRETRGTWVQIATVSLVKRPSFDKASPYLNVGYQVKDLKTKVVKGIYAIKTAEV